jgi:divalent metal cation (Fe/Co/Zn/Cd) transporter
MDESLPGAELSVLKQALDAELASSGFPSDEVEVHDLRTRRAGRRTCIEFHLVVPGEATVEAAHRLCDSMEASVHRLQPEAHVTIHVEPDWKAHRSRPPT